MIRHISHVCLCDGGSDGFEQNKGFIILILIIAMPFDLSFRLVIVLVDLALKLLYNSLNRFYSKYGLLSSNNSLLSTLCNILLPINTLFVKKWKRAPKFSS